MRITIGRTCYVGLVKDEGKHSSCHGDTAREVREKLTYTSWYANSIRN